MLSKKGKFYALCLAIFVTGFICGGSYVYIRVLQTAVLILQQAAKRPVFPIGT